MVILPVVIGHAAKNIPIIIVIMLDIIGIFLSEYDSIKL